MQWKINYSVTNENLYLTCHEIHVKVSLIRSIQQSEQERERDHAHFCGFIRFLSNDNKTN